MNGADPLSIDSGFATPVCRRLWLIELGEWPPHVFLLQKGGPALRIVSVESSTAGGEN